MGVGVQIQSYIIVANPGYLEKSENGMFTWYENILPL